MALLVSNDYIQKISRPMARAFVCQKILTACILFFQFVFEGMEESGSEGLDDLIFERKDTFFKVLLK